MKKVKYLLLCVIALLVLTVASCGDITEGEGEKTIYVSNFNHFVIGSDGDESNKITGNLNAGQVYYLIMRVNYHSTIDTDGTQKIQANLKLYDINVVEGTLDSANSSETKTILFTNSTDEKACMQTTIDFKIPEHKDEETNMEIKIKLTPRFPIEEKEDTSEKREANCRVALDVSSAYKITGAMNNGTTFTLHVNKTKIEAPVISWNEQTFTLEWKHVEYATKYEIYTYETEDPIAKYEVPSQYSVGDIIIYRDIPTLISGEARIRIRAVGPIEDTPGGGSAENYEPTFSEKFVTITI